MVFQLMTTSCGHGFAAVAANDSITLPPITRVVQSSNKAYSFRIFTTDNWRTPFPQGVLTTGSNAKQPLAWRGKLPQHYGPRYVLVTSTGEVILVDGWLNTKPTPAIAILYRGKGSWLSFEFEAVARSLGVPLSLLAEKASLGSWWISGKPYLDTSETRLLIPAGGKTLVVDLRRQTLGSQWLEAR
jgi:hypothetical protein